jgi:hypothetical protein
MACALGRSLTKICQTPGFPTAASVVQWAARDSEFRRKYLQARQIGAQLMADTLIDESEAEIGCDSMARVQARRLAVDTKKWWLSKVLPGSFGDYVEHHVNTEVRVYLPQKDGVSDPRYPASARLIAGGVRGAGRAV